MKKLALISLLCLIQMAYITAQVVSSGKVTIHINNKPLPKVIGQDNTIVKPGNIDIYGKYYALVIGINNYSDPEINKSDKHISDAEQFYNVITRRYTFEKNNARFLPNAKMADIKEALDSLTKKVGPTDNFLIFFAGKGYWDDASQTGFWLPSDAKGIGYWLVPSDEKESNGFAWLSNKMLGDWLSKINSKHTLLITDACFRYPLFKVRSVPGDALIAINKLNEKPGKKAITSGMLSNVQGDFFSYLSDKLEKNTEKYLSSEKLFDSFSKTVSVNTNITPQFGEISSLGDNGGDFIFILRE
ncbi:MAG: caspase family protein [Bacteroidales bacterium]|jgi:hypothetical protein